MAAVVVTPLRIILSCHVGERRGVRHGIMSRCCVEQIHAASRESFLSRLFL